MGREGVLKGGLDTDDVQRGGVEGPQGDDGDVVMRTLAPFLMCGRESQRDQRV